MRAQEMLAAGALLADAVGATTRLVGQVQTAVGSRVFTAIGPGGAGVRLMHDAVVGGVYSLLHGVQQAVPRAASTGALVGLTVPRPDRPAGPAASCGSPATPGTLGDTPLGDRMLGALNGLYGDLISRRYPPLALTMSIRSGGRSVPLTAPAVAAAFPAADGHLVLFVHGLCETDESWRWGAARHGDPDSTFGTRLRDEFGCTPVHLRYNTGLPVWRNGRTLADLLTGLIEVWPVPVRELTLVGHSMGGLVLRSACHQAAEDREAEDREAQDRAAEDREAQDRAAEDRAAGDGDASGGGSPRWVDLVRRVITLGTPHLGAPLEAGVHQVGRALRLLPETAPFAEVLRSRSAGIKDLRFGALIERDWNGLHPDEAHVDGNTEVPLLPHARYYVIAVTVTRDVQHPLGRLMGDLLVLPASATGRPEVPGTGGRPHGVPFALPDQTRLGGLHHFDLLSHPAVYEQLRAVIARP